MKKSLILLLLVSFCSGNPGNSFNDPTMANSDEINWCLNQRDNVAIGSIATAGDYEAYIELDGKVWDIFETEYAKDIYFWLIFSLSTIEFEEYANSYNDHSSWIHYQEIELESVNPGPHQSTGSWKIDGYRNKSIMFFDAMERIENFYQESLNDSTRNEEDLQNIKANYINYYRVCKKWHDEVLKVIEQFEGNDK